jgi:hypothetical protein
MAHSQPHPQCGQVVIINGAQLVDFEIEDWLDRVRNDVPEDMTDHVYGRVLGLPVPLSRTFHNDDLQIHHA